MFRRLVTYEVTTHPEEGWPLISRLIVEATLATAANPTPALWRVITKMVYFAGLVGTFGGGMLMIFVIRPVLHRHSADPLHRAALERRAAAFLAIVGTWFLVALYFQIAGKAARAKGREVPYGEALDPGVIWNYLRTPAAHGEWVSSGTLTLVQYVLWAVSALLLMMLWSPRRQARLFHITAGALTLAFVAHQVTLIPTAFGGLTLHSQLDIVLNHLHVFAISTWVGGIVGLVVLAAAGRRHRSADAARIWSRLWNRFSTLALAAVGGVLISGLYLAWMNVGDPGQLFTTSYGHFLLLKVSLVATMIVTGALNELVLVPRIAKARAAGKEGSAFRLALRTVPALVSLEVALAVCVLFVLTFLTGSAREEVGEAEPSLDGGVITAGVIIVAMLGISLVTAAKVTDRLSAGLDDEPSEQDCAMADDHARQL